MEDTNFVAIVEMAVEAGIEDVLADVLADEDGYSIYSDDEDFPNAMRDEGVYAALFPTEADRENDFCDDDD